ncbi:bifunctional ADF-H-Gelsolin-like domain superfamily/Gelsolin-like domain/von Willebrand factor A-like domain superfamily/Zinc finger [Babesia duncani]|uniref:Bifunctional ADF-H-Gelsolin-like domain superfamily/Gelsolin-like domain/von Willebrand factor A-like domain superfamily/Zinc finger n=1 Tax=Babesia duncani TaxID=323732 RepID=A0AAD9UPZ0_9APIC|nr:bifunctional ADF-H-Gelsolin-like domain superfamily/Gelsolin-like domain/von Willebrand factor A-like domain superfamily/Zinc finger [Babesia duncani]
MDKSSHLSQFGHAVNQEKPKSMSPNDANMPPALHSNLTYPSVTQKHHEFRAQKAIHHLQPTISSNKDILMDNLVPATLTSIKSGDDNVNIGVPPPSTEAPKAPIYINRELEKNIFSYGPIVTNKIDGSQVPRPVNVLIDEPRVESKKGKAVAGELFISTTLNDVPMFGESINRIKVPMVVLVQPFANENVPLVDLVQQIGVTDLAKQDLIRCPKCGAYFNPYMELDARNDLRICNFCYNAFTLKREQLFALDALKNKPIDGEILPVEQTPIMSPSIDYLAPIKYYKNVQATETLTTKFTQIIRNVSAVASLTNSLRSSKSDQSPTLTYDAYGVSESNVTPRIPDELTIVDGTNKLSIGNTNSTLSLSSPTSIGTNTAIEVVDRDSEWIGYIFIIETTFLANRMNVKSCVLDALRKVSAKSQGKLVRFCVMTFNCTLQMYRYCNDSLSLAIVSEVDEPFIPLHCGELFCDAGNAQQCDVYLDFISKCVTKSRGSENCGNYALSLAIRTLRHFCISGTVTIFYSSAPDYGLGKFVDQKVTDSLEFRHEEKLFYDDLIMLCYDVGIAVDVYICAERDRIPCDLILQYICQQTGGFCYYISYFNSICDSEQVARNIERLITVPHGYKCELKIRSASSIYCKEVLLPFSNLRAIINPSTILVPRISPDFAIAFEMGLEDTLETSTLNSKATVYVQCACMYNPSCGTMSKMLRVQTIPLDVTTSVQQMFKGLNGNVLLNYYTRLLASKYLRRGRFDKQLVLDNVVGCLGAYRQLCAPSTPSNQLILPDNLKMLPAHVNALFKLNCKNAYGNLFIQRILRSLMAPLAETNYIYSHCYCMHRSLFEPPEEIPDAWTFTLDLVPSTTGAIYSDGIYLIDDGYRLTLYFGPHVKQALLKQLFGHDLILDEKTIRMQLSDSATTQNLMRKVEIVRNVNARERFKPLFILPYASRCHRILKLLLLEDEMEDESTYVNFLVSLHKLIRQSSASVF